MNSISPIVLFVYNRPVHTQQTLNSLSKNYLASKSELTIYSDAPKNAEAKEEVDKVRSLIQNIYGFKSITIIEREKNWGLAASIIDGVSAVINKHGKVIVLEDDMVTSPYFLTFMNQALDHYQNKPIVWHISGWNYPISSISEQAYLWRGMNCWGWATWADRWEYFDNNVDRVISNFSRNDIKRFNLDGSKNLFDQILKNKKGKLNTWATFWYATIFKNNGLCLNPSRSYLKNIGLDGSGQNCIPDGYNVNLSHSKEITFPEKLSENTETVSLIKLYYETHPNRVKMKVKRLLKKLIPFYLKK